MRVHARSEAEAVVDIVEHWQERFLAAQARRLVYASDEYYLLAGRPFPVLDAYDGCPQHENGIGMARTFEAEVHAALAGDVRDATGVRSGFFAWVDGAPATGYRAPRARPQSARAPARRAGDRSHPRRTYVLTGELGAPVLEPLLAEMPGAPRAMPVANRFFGGNIGVTGLLTGADVASALADAPEDARYLLPDVTLSRGRFLDGTSVADLPRRVEIVPTDGASLVRALQRT